MTDMKTHYLRPLSIEPLHRFQGDKKFVKNTLPLGGHTGLGFTSAQLIRRIEYRKAKETVAGVKCQIKSIKNLLKKNSTFTDRLQLIARPRPLIEQLSISRRDDHQSLERPLIIGPLIMGIVNVTPDSFSDGGDHANCKSAVAHGLKLVTEGADILDIGGESTRPGAEHVSVDEELQRVIPVIEGLRRKTSLPISIDSRKSEVMAAALEAGATMINDVSALSFDPKAMDVARQANCPIVLMHAKGSPETMQDNPSYNQVSLEIFDYLKGRIEACLKAGIDRDKLIIDPGIGFGKKVTHNLQILSHMALFHGLGCPLMLGASRKAFIGSLTGEEQPKERLAGSLTAVIEAARQGVHIIRVHDVKETRQCLKLWLAIYETSCG